MTAVEPIIVVLGPPGGGTSAVTGVLHHLGVFVGTHCGWAFRELGENWEEVRLSQLCYRAIDPYTGRLQIEPDFLREQLRGWAAGLRRDARSAGSRPGVKHPGLCGVVDVIREAWGPIVPVVVDRPLEKVVASASQLELPWYRDKQRLVEPMKDLIARRDAALADVQTVRIDFEELRASPGAVVGRLVTELALDVTDDQLTAAVQSLVQHTPEDRYGLNQLLAKAKRNPEDGRAVFVLAEAVYKTGQITNARKLFEARPGMAAGWDQEVYFSLFRLAESMAKLGEPWPRVEDAYLRAWDFRRDCGEPLLAIATHYFDEQRFRLAQLFAGLAAKVPLPEEGLPFVRDDYTIAATVVQARSAAALGDLVEAFGLLRQLLARPDVPDGFRVRIAAERDFCVPAMTDSAVGYPAAAVAGLSTGAGGGEVTVSVVAGPDRESTEQTLNSLLNCCTDLAGARLVIADAGLAAPDRAVLQQRYGFVEFVEVDSAGAALVQIGQRVGDRFWLHLGADWRFFAPEPLISRLTAILAAEPGVFQVGINFEDAAKLTGATAANQVVRRAAGAGRYVVGDTVARGPAMFDTERLDLLGGIDAVAADPFEELQRRAAGVGLQTATLDEVLCIITADGGG